MRHLALQVITMLVLMVANTDLHLSIHVITYAHLVQETVWELALVCAY